MLYQQQWPGSYPQFSQEGFQSQGFQGQQQVQQPQSQSFSASNYQVPGFVLQQQNTSPGSMLPLEQSFIENILRLNRGKIASFYMTFENNSEWNAKVFRGRIEEAGRDHIVVSNPENGEYYLLLMVTLDYVTFDEPIEYSYPFGGNAGGQALTQYSPR
ncbi:spore coat protein GerQ [Alkalihalobacillus pseudalcaliphilus]|uniref:spore coat protein GerQ n=1 Tax=Alkalihalobacillus pseudalcaliphilus TaxID=79884 RepID=UPI00064D9830|nr:spore coat protein GerQ [Alkalihalobacillus pseudalcaliphilus]KMK78198.1 spore gernimation protein GerQ [Alkalihalobacillus pseudalcaliphilus]